MAKRTTDRFDEIPDDLLRVGAHRAHPQRGRGWIGFAWAALATVALVAAGLFGLTLLNPDLEIRIPGVDTAASESPTVDASGEPIEEAQPALDPNVAISVLNGTTTSGLATQVGDSLVALGWEGAALGVGSRANAATNDVQTTEIYYSDPANEAAVRQLVIDLGVGTIKLSNAYPASPITIVLGADYVPPVA